MGIGQNNLFGGKRLVTTKKVKHKNIGVTSEGHLSCRICGRPLTSVESRMAGVGPECLKKIKPTESSKIMEFLQEDEEKG